MCPLPLLRAAPEAPFTCGTVDVPENRHLSGSRTVHLAVAILGPDRGPALRDPILILTGGPGDPAFEFLAAVARFPHIETLLAHRAIVTFDPRGTGYTTPFDDCHAGADGSIDYQACIARLTKDGFDFAGYTLDENVADVEAVRRAIGAGTLNLYGLSFGTRWALNVARTYPATVRTMVLDAAQPPQVRQDARYAENATDSILDLIAACEQNARCGTAFPNLQARYLAGIASLDAHPIMFRGQTVNGLLLLTTLEGAQYNPALFGALPQAMDQVAHRQIPDLIRRNAIAPLVEPLRGENSSTAVQLTTECGQSVLPRDVPGLEKLARSGLPAAYGAVAELSLEQVCKIWPHTRAAAAELRPVRSAIPTLLYAGQYDPALPLPDEIAAASTLPVSRIVRFPGRGHTQLSIDPCALDIAGRFFEHPVPAHTDAECAADLPQPKWIVP